MINTQQFSDIGLERFLDSGGSLGIGHKLGGDNMSLLDANRQVMETIGEKGIDQSFSVSAFRSSKIDFNTTSKLIEAGESQDEGTILTIFSEIQNFHTELLEDVLLSCEQHIRLDIIDYAKHLFNEYMSQVNDSNLKSCKRVSNYMLGVGNKTYSLLSIGEVIAAKVLVRYLEVHGIPAKYVDITNLKNIAPQHLAERLKEFLKGDFQKIYMENSQAIPIIPGYIGGIDGGILDVLGRGYTDYTAERATVSMYDSERYDRVLFYIQKMYGFKSTDPRGLNNFQQAKSVNYLSYDLAGRAISHRGAGAGLINSYALSPDIVSRKIEILVGNPTDNSDIAYIGSSGLKKSDGIELVLGRDYNSGYDGITYGKRSQKTHGNHIIYLMGDNIQNIGETFETVCRKLEEEKVTYLAGEIRMSPKAELSFVFKNVEVSEKARNILHQELIEKSNHESQVAEIA